MGVALSQIKKLSDVEISGTLSIPDTINVSGVISVPGQLNITGSINTSGNTNGIATYRALLTQTGQVVGTNLNNFQGGLVIGEKYTITNYVSNDDFSNIANCQNGSISEFTFTTNASGLVPSSTTYNNVVYVVTYGDGSYASFNVIVTGGTVADIQLEFGGYNYMTGDTILISGSTIGGIDSTDDITITITNFNPSTNVTGSIFIATGSTPSIWYNNSQLTSNGDIVAQVLENTLGYDVYWTTSLAAGNYVAFNTNTGPLINSYQRDFTTIKTQEVYPFDWGGFGGLVPNVTPFIGNFTSKDDLFGVQVWDWYGDNPVGNSLYYTPIELKIKQDRDTTPVVVQSEYSSFPMSYVAVQVYCGGTQIAFIDTNDSTTVYNAVDLVNVLNQNPETNGFGVWSEDNGSVINTMPTYFRNQFCPDSVLSFGIIDNS
jgi:hypothetical protein